MVTIEGRQRFPVRVRYAAQYRDSVEALRSILVAAPSGAQMPLGQLAEIRQVAGPAMISSENGLLVVTVLLNVRGRDVGSFVEEARRVVKETIPLPKGSYIEWSGQYENEARARERLRIVVPVVLLVIYLLLYMTYGSFVEAAQVLLAVPFGLAGGIYLLYALGYNFSVAVWVGFIALFGTAVQTAVVMVIYLDEAVVRKRQDLGGRLTRPALLEAVTEGALLRLRPKVMTVTTVVASLLPIMWSHSTGAEVMKPLATPVLGGMVSSLMLVLIVTPVVFVWLRERELRRQERQEILEPTKEGDMKGTVTTIVLGLAILMGALGGSAGAAEKAIHSQKTKDAVVTLKSETGQWKPGKNEFTLEITTPDGKPLDAGKASLSTSMAMPGMAPMIAGATLTADKAPGRYAGTISFPDGGVRQVTVSWDGPAGKGSARFSVPVR
jgi:Cu(I)/Ag(I) efflux system membrane protein CusA/SilA